MSVNTTSCTPLAKSLRWCQGRTVLPGVKNKAYRINRANIAAWPTLTKDANGNLTAATYVGNFTLVANATWDIIDILADKSQLTSETQGEIPSKTQLNKLTLVHPTVAEDAAVFIASCINSDDIYLVPCADGKYRVVGCEMFPTKTTASQDQGQGVTGNANTTINVEASDITSAPFYTGEIVTAEGTINPTTNYTVSLSCTAADGTVQIGSGAAGATASAQVASGTAITIKAVAASGKTFQKWSDNDTNATRAIVVSANTTLSATFTTAQ